MENIILRHSNNVLTKYSGRQTQLKSLHFRAVQLILKHQIEFIIQSNTYVCIFIWCVCSVRVNLERWENVHVRKRKLFPLRQGKKGKAVGLVIGAHSTFGVEYLPVRRSQYRKQTGVYSSGFYPDQSTAAPYPIRRWKRADR